MPKQRNGNTLSGGGRTNTWDSQNRPVQCVYGATTSAFTYGSDGLRRSMAINGGTPILFALDGQNVVQEGHSAAGQFVADVTYLNGPRGPEYRKDESTGEVRWYLYDGLGSVVAEVGEPDGNDNPVKSTRKYDVYGAVRGGTGSSDSQHQFVGSLGHATEPDTEGLIYMRARWMDPVVGRFVSEDPAKDGANWYSYCANNPVNLFDFTGKVIGEDVLVQEVTAASASIGAGAAVIQRLEIALYPWAARIIQALEGGPQDISVRICRAKAGEATGIAITNGARQVFVDFFTHGKPHLDVQNRARGWSLMWKELYAGLNKLEF